MQFLHQSRIGVLRYLANYRTKNPLTTKSDCQWHHNLATYANVLLKRSLVSLDQVTEAEELSKTNNIPLGGVLVSPTT